MSLPLAAPLYDEDCQAFRKAMRDYCKKEIVPHVEGWERAHEVPRSAWLGLGAQGYLAPCLPEEYGGSGADFRYAAIVCEELSMTGASGLMATLHADIVAPYILAFGSAEQKARWLPGCASGECITAIAMTEPGTGSDLAGVRTTAVRDGDGWVLNGAKTFISNGICCDLVVVVAKTDPQANPPHAGISLFLVPADAPGFVKGRKLEKMGLHSADTAEMAFVDCRVGPEALLGHEGAGFMYLMEKLQQERLLCALSAQVAAEQMLAWTIDYTKQRKVFGKPISKFQVPQFKMVEMATEIKIGRTFVDDLVARHARGENVVQEVSMAKWWITETANRVAYDCVQLHGGYGYMEEYPICRAYRDIRVWTIFAGSNEIMKTIVAKTMGL